MIYNKSGGVTPRTRQLIRKRAAHQGSYIPPPPKTLNVFQPGKNQTRYAERCLKEPKCSRKDSKAQTWKTHLFTGHLQLRGLTPVPALPPPHDSSTSTHRQRLSLSIRREAGTQQHSVKRSAGTTERCVGPARR